VSIFAGTRGFLDDLDVADVRRFEGGLLEEARSRYGGVLAAIREGRDLPDEELTQAVQSYKERFVAETAAGRAGES
jgi:F-type H+/Na+-transporting ATPase subunit alpha